MADAYGLLCVDVCFSVCVCVGVVFVCVCFCVYSVCVCVCLYVLVEVGTMRYEKRNCFLEPRDQMHTYRI